MLGVSLLAASAPAAALNPEDRAAVGEAFRMAGRGDWRRALLIAAEVQDPLPAKTLRWLRMIEEREPADFATLAGFLLDNPDWPLPEQLQIIAEGTIRDPADHELIRRLFQDRAPLTTRGSIRYAEALFRIDQDEPASALIRRTWTEGDFSASEERKFYQKYRRILTTQDHIDRLDNLLWDYRRSSAMRMLERVPDGYRNVAQARMRLQRRQHGVDKALKEVPAALSNDPGLVFDRLRWRRQKRLHDGVIELLLDPPDRLVHPTRWWFERELQIRRALRSRQFDLAYRLASRHGQTEGEEYAAAEWLSGWLALRFGRQPHTAQRHFERLYASAEAPVVQAQAAYWLGRTAAELGDQLLATEWYRRAAAHRIAYHGQLAAEELGPAYRPPPPPRTADVSLRARFGAKELVRVVRMLIEVDATAQLGPFLTRLADLAESPAEVGLVAELAAATGRPHLITQVGRFAAYYGHVNEGAAFPIPDLGSLVRPRSGEPEAALLLGVARQESIFNPSVASHKGAQGLMQLIPQTAYLMARSLRVPYNRALLTGNPDYNVRLGSHYLKTLLTRYQGATPLAVAAYNAGPRRVDEWLRLHGDPRRGDRYDMIDWIELIPFDETRNYVQRVLEGQGMYRRRLAEPQVAMVWFRPVNGPLDPLPGPLLKPLDQAREVVMAALVARAPRPMLKPIRGGVIPVRVSAPPSPELVPSSSEPAPSSPESAPSSPESAPSSPEPGPPSAEAVPPSPEAAHDEDVDLAARGGAGVAPAPASPEPES